MDKGKTVVLGVSGGIAVYKAADLASRLVKAGIDVRVIMTATAAKLVSPQVFSSLTRNEVVTDLFANPERPDIWHVQLVEQADLILIAPATANTIAKIACGIADNALTATVLASRTPVMVAPAMHTAMYENAATRANLATLKKRGCIIIEPDTGQLASGDFGVGRLPEPEQLSQTVLNYLSDSHEMSGRRVVITAGGTREPLDPVRYVGNHSSGKMGYALAEVARDRGAEVTLISTVDLPPPPGLKLVPVSTAAGMQKAVARAVIGCDALVMAAAVADFRPKRVKHQKIKKVGKGLTLELEPTPDILADTRGAFVRVGFAAESEDISANARKKLAAKELDLIVANAITGTESAFGADASRVMLIGRGGDEEPLPMLPKREVAARIWDRVQTLLG
jgi:phosphopantothenoylcysteine decarboxylase / phosphopantothenate---cysteine ligase